MTKSILGPSRARENSHGLSEIACCTVSSQQTTIDLATQLIFYWHIGLNNGGTDEVADCSIVPKPHFWNNEFLDIERERFLLTRPFDYFHFSVSK